MRVSGHLLLAASAWLAVSAAGATAQEAPAGARTRWITVGGEALASLATDDPGYFDDTSYRQSAMRLMRLRLYSSVRLGSRAALLAEGRADNGDGVTLAALYLRLRPWPERPLDLQVGRI